MDIFFEIFRDLPRAGPGCDSATKEAISKISHLTSDSKILDVGCGPGTQTLELARSTQGKIIAIDTNQPFLDRLIARAKQEGLSERIQTMNMSMKDLKFEDTTFDLIWAEGAIYIMGFQKGLKSWSKFLKPNGYIAVTELSWIKQNPSEEVQKFWNENYPKMKSLDQNLEIIKELGFNLISSFAIPESAWWGEYYLPMEGRMRELRSCDLEEEGQKVLDDQQLEIDLYRKYSDFYAYVFYIIQKV